MSWGEVLFGFHGRINRRTFWSGWILVSVGGLLLIALLVGPGDRRSRVARHLARAGRQGRRVGAGMA